MRVNGNFFKHTDTMEYERMSRQNVFDSAKAFSNAVRSAINAPQKAPSASTGPPTFPTETAPLAWFQTVFS